MMTAKPDAFEDRHPALLFLTAKGHPISITSSLPTEEGQG